MDYPNTMQDIRRLVHLHPHLAMKETSMGEMRLIDAPPCSISDMNVFNEDQTKFDSSCSITDNVKEALDLEHLFDKN